MSIGSSPFQGGGGSSSIADATETTAGKIRIATSTEAETGTNDTTAMTPLTVKERINAAIVGGVEYKGTFNANTGLTNSGGNLNNAEKGDLYIIDTLGTIYGQTWALGDHLLINANMGGSIDNSKIDKVDNTDQVSSVNSQTGAVVLSADDLAADHSASNYTAANANIDGHLEGIDDQFALTAPLASPALTGNPTAPTQSASDNSTKIATTFYVDRAVSAGGASDASETVKGIIEIATDAEAQAASATDKALVPSNIGEISLSSFNNDLSGLGNQINALQIKTGASFTAQANYVYIGSYTSGTQTITMPAASGATSGDIIGFTSNVASRALSLVSSNGTANDIVNQSNQAKGGSSGALSLTVNQQISWFIHNGSSWYEANAAFGTGANLQADNTANNLVKIDSNGKLPAIDGSQLTNLPSGATQLNDLSDVTITGAATGEVLRYSGSAWVDATLAYSDLSGTPTLGTAAASAATDFQPVDPGLTSIAALTTAANKMLFTDGSDSYDTTDLTAFARSLLDDANATTARTTLGAIAELSEDSSPQLGGNLDLAGNDIVTTGNADLGLAPAGTGFVEVKGNSNPGAIRLNCESNSHGVQLQSPPHSATATYQLILPTSVGTAGQVLSTDGGDGASDPTAQLSWTTVSAGGSKPNVTSATPGANYAITTYTGLEEIYLLTPSTDIDVTLPAASSAGSGYKFNIKNLSTNVITLKGATGDNIDTVAPTTGVPITTQYESLTVVTDGSNWFII